MLAKANASDTLYKRVLLLVVLFITITNAIVITAFVGFFNRMVRNEMFSAYVAAKASLIGDFLNQNLNRVLLLSDVFSIEDSLSSMENFLTKQRFFENTLAFSRVNQAPVIVVFDRSVHPHSYLFFEGAVSEIHLDPAEIMLTNEQRKSRFLLNSQLNIISGWTGLWIFVKAFNQDRAIGYLGYGIDKYLITDRLKTSLTANHLLKSIESDIRYRIVDGAGSILYTSDNDENGMNITNFVLLDDLDLVEMNRYVGFAKNDKDRRIIYCFWMLNGENITGNGLFLVGTLTTRKLSLFTNSQIIVQCLVISLVIGLFGHFIMLLVRRRIQIPLNAIKRVTEQFENKNFGEKIEFEAKGEFDELMNELEKVRISVKDYKEYLDLVMKGRNEELQYALARLKTREENLKQDLDFASSIQIGILPGPTVWRELELTPFVKQLDEVGGDLIDIIPENNRLTAYVADISGHGIPASLISMLSKIIFIYAIQNNRKAEDIIREVNERMNSYVARQSIKYINYFTVFFLYFHPDYSFEYLSAGHVPAVLYRRSRDACELLTTSSSMIGVFGSEIVHFVASRENLEPGDKLLIFTDGFINAKSSTGRKYGVERVMKCLTRDSKFSGETLKDLLWQDFLRFTGELPLSDDISFLIVESLD